MTDAPLRIEFVCTANISRSPYAERRAASLCAGHPFVFSSSGLMAREGIHMDPAMVAELRARGLSDEGHRSKPLDADRIDAADALLVMEVRQRQRMLESWPEATMKTFTFAQFVQALESVPQGVPRPQLIEEVFAVRPAPDSREDVTDPYRRGREAASAAAQHLDALVKRMAVGLGVPELPRRAW